MSAVKQPQLQHTPGACLRANARNVFFKYLFHSRLSIIRRLAREFARRRLLKLHAMEKVLPYYDAERREASRYCEGKGIDVGCGSKKTVPSAIGVDLTPVGERGSAGSQLLEISKADITASGDDLPMFKEGELDYVVASHNLEHYQDPVKAIQEWYRVLKPGGRLILVMPDDDFVNTIALDPTHYHVYTKESLVRLLHVIGGFSVVRNDQLIPRWSFILVAKKL
jgi:SAM-dependent methyltransferase